MNRVDSSFGHCPALAVMEITSTVFQNLLLCSDIYNIHLYRKGNPAYHRQAMQYKTSGDADSLDAQISLDLQELHSILPDSEIGSEARWREVIVYSRDRHIHRDEGKLAILSRGDARVEKPASRSGLSIGEGF